MLDHIVWNANPFLIDSFIQVRWYGLMFALGFLIGYEIEARIYRHEGAPEKWLGILLLWTMAGTIIGARLGHVLFYEWDYYSKNPMEIRQPRRHDRRDDRCVLLLMVHDEAQSAVGV